MVNIKIVNRLVTALLCFFIISSTFAAETWYLENGNQWKQVQLETGDKFLKGGE